MFSVLLPLLVAQTQGPFPGVDISQDFVLTKTDAIALLAPRVVSAAHSNRVLWSSDGKYLLTSRTDAGAVEEITLGALRSMQAPTYPAFKSELTFYDVKSQKIRTTIPLGSDVANVMQIEWLPGSTTAVVETQHQWHDETHVGIYFQVSLAGLDGRFTPIARCETPPSIATSPTRPLVAVYEPEVNSPGVPNGNPNDPTTTRLRIWNADRTPIVTIANDAARKLINPVWGKDGEFYIDRLDTINGKSSFVFHRVNLNTGTIEPAASQPEDYEAPPLNLPVVLVSGKLQNLPGSPNTIMLIPVGAPGEKPDMSAVGTVTTDGTEGVLSPTGNAVAYISRGVAMVRALAHVPKDALLNARAAALRTELLSRVKQIGLAALMNSADNDDNLPSANADWKTAFNPYLKSMKMMDGFVYSFRGGNLSQVEKPAETELGFIPGPGGRAVVYTDGHAKWVPNP